MHGSLYQQKAYNSTGDELTRQTVEYDIETKRQLLGESREVHLYGFYIQQKREESIIYGKEISNINSNGNALNVGVKREVEYIISAWFKTEAGFETDGGKAEVKLQFYNDNNPVGNPIIVSIETTDNEWNYWHYAINSDQIQGTSLGYNFEHNFGHGQENLSEILLSLNLLS